MTVFPDRTQGGRVLAQHVVDAGVTQPLLVLALPRGGVPVVVANIERCNVRADLIV